MMKEKQNPYITIGKIGSTYGVQGWLKIHTYTEYGASILDYSPWHIAKPNKPWQSIKIEDGKEHNGGVIAKLHGIDSPEAARLLTGSLIAIQRNQLPELEEDEYYWSDLVGLTVIDQDNNTLGTVSYLLETGSNDVLVVKGEKEQAIPYLPGDTVTSIDLEAKTIHVKWELL